MQVTLDGEPAAFGWSGCATLGDVLARAEKALGLKDRVVTAMGIDGVPADLADRAAWSERPAASVETLALASIPVSRLMLETLDEMKAHLPALREELQAAAAAIRAGREKEALKSLSRIGDLWEACLAVGRDVAPALAPEGDGSLEEQVERLRAAIAPLEEALRRNDLALVADLCAYELPPVVDRWEAALEAWRALAAERA